MGWNGLHILAALADGPKLTRQVAAGLGLLATSARRCLDALGRKGLVTTTAGVHQITETGRVALAAGREIMSGPCGGNTTSRQGPTLRQRAWRAMGMRDGFGLDDLLTMLCDGSERDAAGNLARYLEALEAAGYLLALPRRGQGEEKRWRLRRERITGPEAPALNTGARRLTDHNTGQVYELGRQGAGHGR